MRVSVSAPDRAQEAREWIARGDRRRAERNLTSAASAYAHAVDLGASTVNLHLSRSIVAIGLGDIDSAMAYALDAVRCDPRSAAAQINAAIIEGPLRGYDVALRRLDALEPLGISAPNLHATRALTLYKLGRYAEVLAAVDRSEQCLPLDPIVCEVRALALKELGRFDEAILWLDRPEVLALGSRLRCILAITQMEVGRCSEARRTVRAALAADPKSVFAWHTLGTTDGFATDDSDVEAMRALLADAGAPDRIALNFALGKALLARNEHAAAFEHFRAGNELVRNALGYDVGEDEVIMRDLAREFSRDRLAAMPANANDSERPVFVVGMPRSGTTLVESILAAHPRAFGAGELAALPLIAGERAAYDLAAWPELAGRYLDASEGPAGVLRVIDKMPLNAIFAGFIHVLFPNARIIHCRRDPVDIGISCYTTLFDAGYQLFSYDFEDFARFYGAHERLAAHWRAVLPANVFLEIAYEDVVADVESAARRLLGFCGLPWDPNVLRFNEQARVVRTASLSQVRKPIYRSSIGRAAAFGSAFDPLRAALKTFAPGS